MNLQVQGEDVNRSHYISRGALLFFCLVSAVATALAADSSPALKPLLDNGYRQMYNLDFLAAHGTFQAYQREHPGDPLGHVSNAAAYLFSEFDRLQVLEADLFTDDHKFERRSRLNPDPQIKDKFEKELARTDELVQNILQQHPNDTNALFSETLANGLRSDYAALIEKRNIDSLHYMKTSRLTAEKLLAIDPASYDAYLAIGIENYLMGANPLPIRWVLRLAGAQTDKQEGLQRLRLTADKGHYLAPFARLLLAVAALRDHDSQTARRLLTGLAVEFPGNQLYAKELARLQ